MADYLDLIYVYIMETAAMLSLFCLYTKTLKKKIRFPFYCLFAVCMSTYTNFIPMDTTIGFGLFVLLLTAYGAWFCHAGLKPSLLYATLMTVITLLCIRIVKFLLASLYPVLPASLWDKDGVLISPVCQSACLILAVFCYYIVYRYFSFYTSIETQHMFLVLIPVLMIYIMSKYVSTIEYSFEILESSGPTGHLFTHWQMLAMHLLGLASLFCVLFTYKKLLQNFRLRTELSLLEQEEHSLNQYVEEARAHYKRTESFCHDIKNHITVIKKLLQSGNLEQAVTYIEDMDDMAEKISFPCDTNNPVADILVGNKLGIAKSIGINASCSLHLPYPCGLRNIDICIILSNALDNAIHACGNMDADIKKYIHVSGRVQGNFLMIEIENSYQGNGVFKKGTGLSNVKMIAEKYGGAMSVEALEHEFVFRVLLIIPEQTDKN